MAETPGISSGVITLYHGSAYTFDEIDVSKGKPYKDLGMGFYTSRSRKHAETLALRNKAIEIIRRKKINSETNIDALLYIYDFDPATLRGLSVKVFHEADKDWMRFVVMNRTSATRKHSYDVVIGPTANDNTRISIRAFFAGAYGDIQGDEAIDTLIRVIETDKLPSQFFFGSDAAARLLSFKGRAMVK